jgi:hypothetical protein
LNDTFSSVHGTVSAIQQPKSESKFSRDFTNFIYF